MTQGRIRRAAISESEALTSLARRAKSHWPYEPDTLTRMTKALVISPATIAGGIVLVHETAGVVDGVGAVEKGDDGWELTHLWVEPSRMRAGIGRRLIAALARQAREAGADQLIVQSDPHAEPFYRRMGATRIGTRESTVIPGRHLPLLRLAV